MAAAAGATWWTLGRSGGEATPAFASERKDLLDALARTPFRTVEGRLSGAAAYVPLRPATRGAARPDLPPDVRIAGARLEQALAGRDTPAANAALGVAYLAVGNTQRAVEVLEDAVQQQPRDAAFQNDLAVTYAARAASAGGDIEDWVRALAAANRAIAADAMHAEAHFNRAIALHGLHLASREAPAWKAYLDIDHGGGWADEARRRLSAVSAAALDVPDADRQATRERIEDDLLGRWAAAYERRDHAGAASALDEADTAAAQLASEGGDVMPRDEIRRIRRALVPPDRAAADLAAGHRLYSAARQLWVADDLPAASARMSEASVFLARADSPYAHWAAIYRALLLRNKGEATAARTVLRGLSERVPSEYLHLRGRLDWTESLVFGGMGRYDLGRTHITRAAAAFQQIGERDYFIATQTIGAEADWLLGEYGGAWTKLGRALAAAAERGTRRLEHLDLASIMALGSNLPEAALEFQSALVARAALPGVEAEVYLRRARTHVRLRNAAAAEADLVRAATALTRFGDATLGERLRADIEMVRADLLTPGRCDRALEHGRAAMKYFANVTGTARRAALLTLSARCRAVLGDTEAAKADLLAAADLFEARRGAFASATDRVRAIEQEREVFRNLVALELDRRRDEVAAFHTAERARAGVFAEAWQGDGVGLAGRAQLAPGVAVLYFETFPDRVVTWVLTRQRQVLQVQPIGEADVARMARRIRRAIDDGADLTALRPASAVLFDRLVAPALTVVDRDGVASRIVVVPDGPLYGVPFAALPDAAGHALLESRVVLMAPSLRTFFAASSRLSTFTASDVVAVGDGHDPAGTGLPPLAHADDEARQVGALYGRRTVLAGADATRQRLLAANAAVIHFAGHSVLNERYPMFSRMLLAPGREGDASGFVFSSEVAALRFPRTGVAVLATCDGAAGRTVEGEGAISMARAFFAAGVPAVIASLWAVDDDLQPLMVALHRQLRDGGDPATALAHAQRALILERGARTPVRVWGGFIMLGGLKPGREGTDG